MYRSSIKYKIILIFCCTSAFAQEKAKLVEAVNMNIGVTLFKNQYRDNRFNNHFSYLAKALNVGLEVYNKPWNMSIDVRKTYWLGLSASSHSTDIGATASYNQVGFTKYLDLTNKKRMAGINLSHIWLAEYDAFFGLGNSIAQGFYQVDTYWTSKAFSIAGSVNITKCLFVELKFNYYYYIGNYYINNNLSIPKKGINDNRTQVSFIYKINREKK